MLKQSVILLLLFAGGTHGWAGPALRPAMAAGRTIAAIDLAKPFGTRSPWRFVATQGAAVPDPLGDPDDAIPGVIRLCFSAGPATACQPNMDKALVYGGKPDDFAQPHYLEMVRIVRPRPDLPLLLVRVASRHGGNGDQRVAVVAYRYDRAADAFAPAFARQVARNNNQEVRYIEHGPLQGAFVTAMPTQDAPFGFWMTVDRIGGDGRYREVLRYRSATRYGDGNPLAVIDSEMPGLQRRLGLWRPGRRLPLPDRPCHAPSLVKGELWCSPHRP
ncbi:hypothetical protein [Sphingomonas sp.]|uniref:hypothetical protein n=1 Tax=Sphingomonas sp. TaxID=28214 RepID=UPI00258A0ED3|nr:hypothetical protein [Sphingomonas sp.]